MRKTSLFVLTVLASACGGSDPMFTTLTGEASEERIERRTLGLFDARELERTPAERRAYVMGHAFGVFVYSQTLPRWVAGTGWRYVPGASSRRLRYSYHALVTNEPDAPNGLPPIQPGDECYYDGDELVCPDDRDGDGQPDTPPSSTPAGDLPDSPNTGDPIPDPNGGGSSGDPTGDDDPRIDDDCESFLDPAAMEARAVAARVEPERVLEEGFAPDEAPRHVDELERGISDALALEDRDEDTDVSEPEHLKDEVQAAGLCEHSPLVLDLHDDGIDAGDPRDGVRFDLRQTGVPLLTAWPRGDDALLVLDRNGDGVIGDGGELFGNTRRFANGFASLAELDDQKDGVIDAKDAAFEKLQLWRDTDRDGQSDKGELTSLSRERIGALSLSFTNSKEMDAHKNRLALIGTFIKNDGRGKISAGAMIDVWFRVQATGAKEAVAELSGSRRTPAEPAP